jgi:predicted O-methyltransferase YrrM
MPSLLERCPVLRDMLATRHTTGQFGEKVPVHSNLPPAYAEALYRTVLDKRPAVALEVGMAFGVSSLAILSALDEAGSAGRLISIDPYQTAQWQGCGAFAVRRAGFEHCHELIEEPDYLALPRLLASGLRLDFAYIDGWHTFDYTLIDWWYADRMLNVGGIAGFNDCGWPAVDKAIRFVLSHRKYEEIDVGLPVEAANYSRWRGLMRRLAGGDNSWYRQSQDRYFRKLEDWEPRWDFFAEF